MWHHVVWAVVHSSLPIIVNGQWRLMSSGIWHNVVWQLGKCQQLGVTCRETHTHTQILFYIEHGGGGGKDTFKIFIKWHGVKFHSHSSENFTFQMKWINHAYDIKFISNRRRLWTALAYDANVDLPFRLISAYNGGIFLNIHILGSTNTR